jgi:hypothetical protein
LRSVAVPVGMEGADRFFLLVVVGIFLIILVGFVVSLL